MESYLLSHMTVLQVIFMLGMFISLPACLVVVTRFLNFYRRKNFNFETSIVEPKRISVVIPARNEERRLPRLLESLVRIGFNEIIVVDDGSNDNTIKVAASYGVKVIKVKDFYPQKGGKSVACYVGALNSQSEYIVFLDSDLFFEDGAFEYILKNVPKDGALSIQPYHVTKKFFEKFSLYFNIVVVLGLGVGRFYLPFSLKKGYFGPFLLVRREDYFKAGGHIKFSDAIVEDVELGNEMMRLGINIYSIPHRRLVKFRMYEEGFGNLIDGWTKNAFAGSRNLAFGEIILVSGLLAFVVNLLCYGITVFNTPFFQTFMFFYFVYWLFIHITSNEVGNFGCYSTLFPIFAVFFIFVFVRSFYFYTFRKPIKWRGREVRVE